MKPIGDGALRHEDERFVPSLIWNLSSFQAWYSAQRKAGSLTGGSCASFGNKLVNARLLYNYQTRKSVFLWVLKVSIYLDRRSR